MVKEFHRRLTLAFTLVALAIGGGAALYVYWVTTQIDAFAVGRQTALVQRAFNEAIIDMGRQQQTVTVWDDAVAKTRAGDQKWMAENIGEWMRSFFGHDEVYVLDAHNMPVYAMEDGKTVPAATFEAVRPRLERLANDLRRKLRRAPDRGAAEAHDVMMIAGTPALVSIKAIVPSNNRVAVDPGDEFIHISVIDLTDAYLRQLGEHHLVSGLRYSPHPSTNHGEISLPLAASGGPIGYAVWPAVRPGLQLISRTAPVIAFAVICAVALMFWLNRILRRMATELQASERRANFIARHDPLTGLPNRLLFYEQTARLLKTRAPAESLALLFIDLDRFKNVNDTLGHAAGDDLLQEVASRLEQAVEHGSLARFGGDEFAVLLQAPALDQGAIRTAERILSLLREPFELLGSQAYVDASIGIAVAPRDGLDMAELARKADIALYEAKRRGRGCSCLFTEDMDQEAQLKRQIEADLRAALLAGDQFQLNFQPIYAPGSDLPIGAEALIRWNHPTRGALSPAVFIAVAEERGLIRQIGEWVIDRACSILNDIDLAWIAVNASSIEIEDPEYASRVLEILAKHGVSPSRIQIEVTETVLLNRDTVVAGTLGQLRSAGVRIALDDFGTGYSSLGYLHDYPVDKIKIDQSFVRPLGNEAGADAIVRAMLDLGQAFEISVTAEGVETRGQYDRLVEMGCGELQGYLLSGPIGCDALKQLISDQVQRRTS